MKAARLLCAIAALSLAPASRAQTLGVFADSLVDAGVNGVRIWPVAAVSIP